MKTAIALCSTFLIAAPACATPHHKPVSNPTATATAAANSSTINNTQGGNGGNGGSSRNSSSINNEINYPQNVPDIVGPVPRGYVPVLSVYGGLDYLQRGTVGAQLSIPLAR